MVVEFSKKFIKSLQKVVSQAEAKRLVRKLSSTSPSDGDFVTMVSGIVIREKRLKTFRFYFIFENAKKHVVSLDELKDLIIQFVALSKKNNQQHVIDKLKDDLSRFGFRM